MYYNNPHYSSQFDSKLSNLHLNSSIMVTLCPWYFLQFIAILHHIVAKQKPAFLPVWLLYYISVRPWSARSNVTSSIYSRSPPTGTPLAILVTLIPVGFISLLMYIAVVSPSRLEFVAIITYHSDLFQASAILLPEAHGTPLRICLSFHKPQDLSCFQLPLSSCDLLTDPYKLGIIHHP